MAPAPAGYVRGKGETMGEKPLTDWIQGVDLGWRKEIVCMNHVLK